MRMKTRKNLDHHFEVARTSSPFAFSPACFALSGKAIPLRASGGYPSVWSTEKCRSMFSFTNLSPQKIDLHHISLLGLDCAERECLYRLAIEIEYEPRAQRFRRIGAKDLHALLAPFNALQETIILAPKD